MGQKVLIIAEKQSLVGDERQRTTGKLQVTTDLCAQPITEVAVPSYYENDVLNNTHV